MLDKPAYFPPPPSSMRWHQQEQEQQSNQFSSTMTSHSKDSHLAGRLSPELEIMRPISPFQVKRQLPHQHAQLEQHSNALSSYHQSRPLPGHSYDRVPPVLEMTVPTSASSSARPRYKGESSNMRGHHKDSDISPALRMMSYETNLSTPPSSDVGHTHARYATAATTRERRIVQESRPENARPNSPEGGRRRNPGWRKPVPKYNPTPPSTPPSIGESALSSAQNDILNDNYPIPREDIHAQPPPSKAATALAVPTHEPPPRPTRTETAFNVPVMFRDLTSNTTLEASRSRPLPAMGRSTITDPSAAIDAAPRTATSTKRTGYVPVHVQRTQSRTQAQSHTKASPLGPRPVPAAWKTTSEERQAPVRPVRTYAQAASGKVASTPTAQPAPQPQRLRSGTTVSQQIEVPLSDVATPASNPQADGPVQERVKITTLPQHTSAQSSVPPTSDPHPISSATPVNRQASEARLQAHKATTANAVQAQQSLQVPAQAHVSPQVSQVQTLNRSAHASSSSLHLQLPPQAHLHSHGNSTPQRHALSHTSPPVVQSVVRLAQSSTTSITTQTKPQAEVQSVRQSPRLAVSGLEARTESQRSGQIHPPPRKVPSIAQLVARVLTPSPRVSERSLTIEDHSSVGHTNSKLTLNENVSRAPSPLTRVDAILEPTNHLNGKLSQTTFHTAESSGKSSRAESPLPNLPPPIPDPSTRPRSPIVSVLAARPRSPQVAPVIPQYAPPRPPFPAPPPNSPVVAPKPRVASIASILPFMNVEQLEEELAKDVPPVPPARPQSKLQEIQTTAVFRSSLATPPDTPPSRTASQSMVEDAVFEHRTVPEKILRPDPPAIVSTTRPMTPTHKVATVQQTVAISLTRSKTGPPSSSSAPTTSPFVFSQARAQVVPTVQAVPVPPVESEKRSGSPLPPSLVPAVHTTSSTTAPRARPAVSANSQRENVSTRTNFVNTDVAPPVPPSTPANIVMRETSAQLPQTLPADWKEAIMRAIRSSVTPVPANFDENSSNLPPLELALQETRTDDQDESPTFTITGTWVQVKNMPTALDLQIHEEEARPAPPESIKPVPETVFTPIHIQEIQTRSQTPEVSLVRTKEVVPEPATNHVWGAEPVFVAPSRARSPVSRRKPPKVDEDPKVVARQEEEAWALVPSQSEPEAMGGISSNAAVSHKARSSHSRSSGHRRRTKNTQRRRAEDESFTALQNAQPEQEEVTAEVASDIELLPPVLSPPPLIMDTPTSRCITPPPRNESLNQRTYAPSPEPRRVERLPQNGSQRHLPATQFAQPKLDYYSPEVDALTSPSLPSRSLSPTGPAPSAPPKQSKPRLHPNHKHSQSAEVTQTFRPPTPPLPPSHYRKKRSEDVLPGESLSPFMKPPVHVIYPDTSTSHGHSFSNDSMFAMTAARSPPVKPIEHITDDVEVASAGTYEQQQSPSMSSLNFSDRDGYETYEDRPKVPPKANRARERGNSRRPPKDRNYTDFSIHPVSRGRYPSEPMGEAKAHTLTLPPSDSGHSRSQNSHQSPERAQGEARYRNRGQPPPVSRAARSLSEKVERRGNSRPITRTRSSPLPTSRRRQRRGVWRIFGVWARIFVMKFRSWASTSSDYEQSSGHGHSRRYYDHDDANYY